jgi:hypothetical protein
MAVFPRSMKKTILQCTSVEKAFGPKKVINDIFIAQERTLNYYVKKFMQFRFRGQRYNPDYPKLSPAYLKRKVKMFGVKPKLVATGALRSISLASRAYQTTKGPALRLKTTVYSKFVKRRFNYISPKMSFEQKALNKYMKLQLRLIRKKYQNRR